MSDRINDLLTCVIAYPDRQLLTEWIAKHLHEPITLAEITSLRESKSIQSISSFNLMDLLKETEINCYTTRLLDQQQDVDNIISGMISSCFSTDIVTTILKTKGISEKRRKETASAFIMSFEAQRAFDMREQEPLQQTMDKTIEFRLSLAAPHPQALLEKCCHYYLMHKNEALFLFVQHYFSALTYPTLCHSMIKLLKNPTLLTNKSNQLTEQLLTRNDSSQSSIDKLQLLKYYCNAIEKQSEQKCPETVFDLLAKLVLYTQQLSFQQGASEAGKGVYNKYMTEADGTCNAAENSSTKCISTEFDDNTFDALFYSLYALQNRGEYRKRSLALWKKLANTLGATFVEPQKLILILERLKTLESSRSETSQFTQLFRNNLGEYLASAFDAAKKTESWHLYLINKDERDKVPQQDYALQLKLKNDLLGNTSNIIITMVIFEKGQQLPTQEVTLDSKYFNTLQSCLDYRKRDSFRIKEDSTVPADILSKLPYIKLALLKTIHWNTPNTHDSLVTSLKLLATKDEKNKAFIITEHSLAIRDPDAIRASILSPTNAQNTLSNKIWRENPETFAKTLLSSLDSDSIWESVNIITAAEDLIPCIKIIIYLLQALKNPGSIRDVQFLQTRVIYFINEQLPIVLIEKNKSSNSGTFNEVCFNLCQSIKQCLTTDTTLFSFEAMTEQLKAIRPSSKKTSLWDLAEICGQLIAQPSQTDFHNALMDAIDSHQLETDHDKKYGIIRAQRRKTIEIMKKCKSVLKEDLLRLFAIKTSDSTHAVSQLSRLPVSILANNDIPEATLIGEFWKKNSVQDALEVLRGYPDRFRNALEIGLSYFKSNNFANLAEKLFELFRVATFEEQKHILEALRAFNSSAPFTPTITFLNNLFNISPPQDYKAIMLSCFKIWPYQDKVLIWKSIHQEKLFDFLKTTNSHFFDPINTQELKNLHSLLGENLFWQLVSRLYPEGSEKKAALTYQLWTNNELSDSIFLKESMPTQELINQSGQTKPYEFFFKDSITDLIHIYQEQPSIRLAYFLGNWLCKKKENTSELEYNELLCLIVNPNGLLQSDIDNILKINACCKGHDSSSTRTSVNIKTATYLFLENRHQYDETVWKQQFWTHIDSWHEKNSEEFYLKTRDTLYCIFNAGGEKAQWAYQELIDKNLLVQLPYNSDTTDIKRCAIDTLRLCFAMNPVQIYQKYPLLVNTHLAIKPILDSKIEAEKRNKKPVPIHKEANWLKQTIDQNADHTINLTASIPDADWRQLKRHIRKNTQNFPDWVYNLGQFFSNLWKKMTSCFSAPYQSVDTTDKSEQDNISQFSKSSASTTEIARQLTTVQPVNLEDTVEPPIASSSGVVIHSVPVLTGKNSHILLATPKDAAANNISEKIDPNTNALWAITRFRKNRQ